MESCEPIRPVGDINPISHLYEVAWILEFGAISMAVFRTRLSKKRNKVWASSERHAESDKMMFGRLGPKSTEREAGGEGDTGKDGVAIVARLD